MPDRKLNFYSTPWQREEGGETSAVPLIYIPGGVTLRSLSREKERRGKERLKAGRGLLLSRRKRVKEKSSNCFLSLPQKKKKATLSHILRKGKRGGVEENAESLTEGGGGQNLRTWETCAAGKGNPMRGFPSHAHELKKRKGLPNISSVGEGIASARRKEGGELS